MHYVDTHIHLDFYDNPKLMLEEYERRQIYTIFVTNLPELFEKHYPMVKKYHYIRLALGYHPELVTQYPFNKDIFDKYLPFTNYIGEVGIDTSIRQRKYIDEQFEALKYVTRKEINKGKIYTIHSKGSEKEIFNLLVDNKVRSAIFHWYTGNINTVKSFSEAGYYFSINPSMLKSKKGNEVLKVIPQDKLLFESDGPFCKYNGGIVTPESMVSAYHRIDEILGLDFKELVFNNFKRLLVNAQLDRNSS